MNRCIDEKIDDGKRFKNLNTLKYGDNDNQLYIY